MKLLVTYATTEGHTRKIARKLADHFADQGHAVELLPLADAADPDLGRFDGAVLAASVHMNAYQRDLTDFVARHAAALDKIDTLFVSVSLTAAGHDADDWRGLEKIVDDLSAATGWTPGRVVQAAGAYTPSQYDILRAFVMRRIMAARESAIDLGRDHEFTDWTALFETVDNWLGATPKTARAPDNASRQSVEEVAT